MNKIAKTTTILIALITCLWGNTIAIQALAAEKWESNMKKDFAKVLREKKRSAEKHRDFIRKWQEEGRLSALLTLYEAEKENRQAVFCNNQRSVLLRFGIHACTTRHRNWQNA